MLEQNNNNHNNNYFLDKNKGSVLIPSPNVHIRNELIPRIPS